MKYKIGEYYGNIYQEFNPEYMIKGYTWTYKFGNKTF